MRHREPRCMEENAGRRSSDRGPGHAGFVHRGRDLASIYSELNEKPLLGVFFKKWCPVYPSLKGSDWKLSGKGVCVVRGGEEPGDGGG